MKAFTLLFPLTLLNAAAGCTGGALPVDPASAPSIEPVATPVPPAATSASQQFAVRDRVQSSYLQTAVHLADDSTLVRGHAELEIVYGVSRARIALKLSAANQADAWQAVIPVNESAILQTQLDEPTDASERLVRGGLVSQSRSVRLTLERRNEAGHHARFHGRLFDAAGGLAAEFHTQLSIVCLVPPELLGVIANGHSDPASPEMALLVNDEDLRSAYCAKFSDLL